LTAVAVCRPESKENPALPFTYQSGEEIKKGDRVLFHGEQGEIEFVVDGSSAILQWIGMSRSMVEPSW
jgi:hypothetical protein